LKVSAGFQRSPIPIAEQPSLPGERAADVRDEITSGRQQVEDPWKAQNPPFSQIGNDRGDLLDLPCLTDFNAVER
jgi:hypothetical protein